MTASAATQHVHDFGCAGPWPQVRGYTACITALHPAVAVPWRLAFIDSSCSLPFWTRNPGRNLSQYTSWAAPQLDLNAHFQKPAGEVAPTVRKPGCNFQVQNST